MVLQWCELNGQCPKLCLSAKLGKLLDQFVRTKVLTQSVLTGIQSQQWLPPDGPLHMLEWC